VSASYCSQNNDKTPFSTLIAEVLISLPEVAEPIINAAMFRAATDFLSKTRVMRDRVSIDYQQHTDEYPVEPDDCYSLITVEKIWINGCEIDDKYWESATDGWIKLHPAATKYCDGTKFEAEVVLSLNRGSCEIPTYIYERFGDGIINGTLSRLYGMHDTPWYDPNLVRFYGGIGRQSVTDAKTLVQQENNSGEIEIRGVGLIL